MLPTESSVQVRTIQGVSPRAWGGVQTRLSVKVSGQGFPTRVGVFLNAIVTPGAISRLPHARGGVSYSDKVGKEVYGSSPRTRGRAWMNALFSLAFPTRMGCFGFILIR